MRPLTTAVLLPAVWLCACGVGSSDPRPVAPTRAKPEATVARWVATGDCSLWTDRNVSQGYPSVAEGRRACQRESDRTPPEPYTVQATHARGKEAMVVLKVKDGTRLTFWLVARGERGWRIDDYEERRPGDGAIGAAEVIAAFERRTGERLVRLPEQSSLYYETLGLPELDPPARAEDASPRLLELYERFGAFSIYVAESDAEAKRIDGTGVVKRYDNVVLAWSAGKATRTDRRFRLLDAILRSVS